MATFERVAVPPLEARCIFFTIAGENHDADRVRQLKRQLFGFRSEPIPSALAGTWSNTISTESDGAWESTLRTDHDTARLIVRSLEYPDIPAEELTGPLEVSGNLLRAQPLYCGALSTFELTENQLVVSPDGINSVTFNRVAD